jgi:hypothetical protein
VIPLFIIRSNVRYLMFYMKLVAMQKGLSLWTVRVKPIHVLVTSQISGNAADFV